MSHSAEKDASHPVLTTERGDSYLDGLRQELEFHPERADQIQAEIDRVEADLPPGEPEVVETADEEAPPEKATPAKPRARKK